MYIWYEIHIVYKTNTGNSASNIIYIRDTSHFEAVLKEAGSKLVAVDFFTTWCGPCKRIAPVFEELANSYASKVVFAKVDGDQCSALTSQQGVTGFPTFKFFVNGKVVETFSGADENRLRRIVSQYGSQVTVEQPSPYAHFPLKDSEIVRCLFVVYTVFITTHGVDYLFIYLFDLLI